jgi:UDP-2,4-diacetamido-2,4,6-trideoxy-beta-L-altropyranose hydrolase
MSFHLLIRADADTAMGTGHVMRCLALAAQWPGNVTFAGIVESHVRERVVRAGHRFAPIPAAHPNPADLQSTLSLAEELSAAWIVLDGYHFDPDYHQAVRDAGYRLLVIDDNAHRPHYHADLLLNQNIYASELDYQVDDDTVLVLGTRYALLRPEFVERGPSPLRADAHHVLVTLGGGDPDNVTLTVLEGIRLLEDPGLRVRVVVGMANPNRESLVTLAETDGRIELLENVQDMPGLMAWTDAAISAGGSTNWELCYMGVPNVIVILADNQEPIAQGLAAAGASVNLGWHTAVTPRQIADALSRLLGSADRRQAIRQQQQQLVDGLGAVRVVGSLQRPRILYMGNNRVGWQALKWLIQQGADIVGLVVHPPAKRKFVDEMLGLVNLPADRIFDGSRLREASVREAIAALQPDIGLSIFFGYILKSEFISLFPLGVVNLHPSYLPYNRGQYPNVWSIIEGTPAGVTIHYIDAGIDTGDLIAQREVPVTSVDTGQTLYLKLESASLDLFKETWPLIAAGKAPRITQSGVEGTFHKTKDVEQIDRINLDARLNARELIDILRARTFPPYSGAYFIDDDGRRVDVLIELRYAEDKHDE